MLFAVIYIIFEEIILPQFAAKCPSCDRKFITDHEGVQECPFCGTHLTVRALSPQIRMKQGQNIVALVNFLFAIIIVGFGIASGYPDIALYCVSIGMFLIVLGLFWSVKSTQEEFQDKLLESPVIFGKEGCSWQEKMSEVSEVDEVRECKTCRHFGFWRCPFNERNPNAKCTCDGYDPKQ
jgi:hypothetical protein